MIEEYYVTFEQAKLLKEKGFPQSSKDVEFNYYYDNEGYFHFYSPLGLENHYPDFCFVMPTLSLVAKWFRKEKDIHICPIKTHNIEDSFYTLEINEDLELLQECQGYSYGRHYVSYEEALSAGIDAALKLI